MLATFFAFGQAPEFTVRHFDRDDGLLYDKFNAFISSDSRGFTWVGSSHGVFRMDGSTFKHYPIPASTGFEDFVQSECFEDKYGMLWFTTVDGLHVYDYTVDTLRSIRLDSSLLSWKNAFHAFHYNKQHHEILISNGSHVARVDLKTESVRGLPQEARSMRFAVKSDDLGNTFTLGIPWFIGPGLELLTWPSNSTLRRKDSKDAFIEKATIYAACFSDDSPVGLIENEKESAWLGSSEGLLHYDFEADTLIAQYLAPNARNQNVWDILLKDELIYLVLENDGLHVFNHVTRQWLGRVNRSLNTEDNPRSVHQSYDGTLWTMQEKGGIEALIPASPNIKVLRDEQGTPLDVRTFYRGISNELWAGTTGGHIRPYGKSQGPESLKDLPNLAKSRWAASSTQLPNGSHLIGVKDQLYQSKSKGEWTTIFSDRSYIYGVHYNEELESVIITTKKGIYKLQGDKSELYLKQPMVRPLFHLSGTKYIDGKEGPYTYIFDLKNAKFNKTDSIPFGASILSITSSPDNGVWLGTIRGLFSAKKDSISHEWKISKPLKEDRNFFGLYVDKEGILYASTDKGLNLRGLDGRWQTWQTLDGLPSNEGVLLAPLIEAAGSIWMATEKGVVGLSKSLLPEKRPVQKNYFSDLWINERPDLRLCDLHRGQRLELDYSENTIDVGVGTLGFIDGPKSPIEYLLSPYQTEWATLRSGSVLRFTKVPPGEYTLSIRLKDENKNQQAPLTASISIKAPYWQTWWFKLAILAGILGLGFGIAHLLNRRKLAHAKRQLLQYELLAKERDRIARELHDDLGGDLSNILFLSEGKQLTSEVELREKISQLSRASLDHMRDIIWALQTNQLSVYELHDKICEHGFLLCDPRGFDFELQLKGEELMKEVNVGTNLRRNLILIAKEAITNAVRHSEGTEVKLSGRMDDKDEFILSISDNGSGFDISKAALGNGTINMKKRVTQLNGAFNLNTTPGKGTTITITIPLDSSKVGGA